jgi:hypothetical protein
MRALGRVPVISFLHPDNDSEWIAMTAICIPRCTFDIRSGPESGWPEYIIESKPISATGVDRENALKNLQFAVEEAFKALKEPQADEIAV